MLLPKESLALMNSTAVLTAIAAIGHRRASYLASVAASLVGMIIDVMVVVANTWIPESSNSSPTTDQVFAHAGLEIIWNMRTPRNPHASASKSLFPALRAPCNRKSS